MQYYFKFDKLQIKIDVFKSYNNFNYKFKITLLLLLLLLLLNIISEVSDIFLFQIGNLCYIYMETCTSNQKSLYNVYEDH